MNVLSNLKYNKGSKKNRKRIGRGEGSGHGGTSTVGMNGQKSRRGYSSRAWFEGGQMPLQRRVPKRGFTNIFRVNYQPINVDRIQKLIDDKKIEDGIVNQITLYKNGLLSKAVAPYKILGNGELKAKVTVEAHKFSESAKQKIEAAGGSIKVIEA
ncbi:MAG: 50S ribosomal protein L15 [Melioribacteraceae bacterium]|nr:50S ribosomal protein L15 [Melioribacteraceae bacterium]MCF8264224.1 50S ribosomal protein L15 [Melioribacteraceae bacterium]MCF8414448.1 50S ribosomal protein L15 [Melioribacteraceae bacterium]